MARSDIRIEPSLSTKQFLKERQSEKSSNICRRTEIPKKLIPSNPLNVLRISVTTVNIYTNSKAIRNHPGKKKLQKFHLQIQSVEKK